MGQLTTQNTQSGVIPLGSQLSTVPVIGAQLVLPVGPTQGLTPYEVGPMTVTSSGQTPSISNEIGSTVGAVLNVTAVSGTLPTLDVKLQINFDGGSSWRDLYHFERQTSIAGGFGGGVAVMPALPANGQRRWVWTVGGTGAHFTFSISTMGSGASVPLCRQFYDRTPALLAGTLGASSAVYATQGLTNFTVVLSVGAASKAAGYQIQMSMDGVNFYLASPTGPGLSVANSTVVLTPIAGIIGHYIRVVCSTAGTAQTGNYVGIFGWN